MIQREQYSQVIFDAIHKGATDIAPDVRRAFQTAIGKETSPAARNGLERTYDSICHAKQRDIPVCPDTGWPIFYFKIGNDCQLEGGMMGLEEATRDAVRRATKAGYLRATMKHPLTGYDPGDNVGLNIPDFTYQFVPGDGFEVTYVAKGGGSECFGGTRHRVVAFADGIEGIEKFVIDAFVDATRSGGICPPSVLGIGIGGTANIAASLAKEAACLRTVGSRNPEPAFRKLEENLYEAINSMKIGIMGIGGDTSVFSVNVEYAYTHIAGICVDISCNCMVARRATFRICEDGTVLELDSPNWFGGR